MNEILSPMDSAMQFTGPIQSWINDVFVWIGFGTVIGLAAKALMPGRDPGGAVATLAMGIGGTVIGCGTWSLILEGQRVTPISPIGLVVATAGAFSLLFFYRLLGGYWFLEGERPTPHNVRRRDQYRRKLAPASQYEYDD